MKVLLTDAHALATLAVARSLGKKGLEISCIGEKESDLSFSSKYVKEKIIAPSYKRNPEKYVEFLIKILRM